LQLRRLSHCWWLAVKVAPAIYQAPLTMRAGFEILTLAKFASVIR
jgi:hypothetical protein